MRAEFSAPEIHYDRDGKPATFSPLRGSVSLHGKELVVTAVNANVKDALETQIIAHGARMNLAKTTVLTAPDIHAHNTFDQKQAVVPQTKDVEIKGQSLTFTFPPASVVKLQLSLA